MSVSMNQAPPWAGSHNRKRLIRSTPNPLDKATVVSIFPIALAERKPTIEPGFFRLDAGSLEKPAFLIVGPSSWWRETYEDGHTIEIPTNAIQVADSIVNDYCGGFLGVNMGDHMPGLAAIPGEYDLVKLNKDYPLLLGQLNIKQRNWYKQLVDLADNDWARTNGNPLCISDLMKLAARSLGIETKDWLSTQQAMELIRCIMCGTMRNPAFPMCPNCKTVIDIDKAKQITLTVQPTEKRDGKSQRSNEQSGVATE